MTSHRTKKEQLATICRSMAHDWSAADVARIAGMTAKRAASHISHIKADPKLSYLAREAGKLDNRIIYHANASIAGTATVAETVNDDTLPADRDPLRGVLSELGIVAVEAIVSGDLEEMTRALGQVARAAIAARDGGAA